MPNIVMYGSPRCPYCQRACQLLDGKGVAYTFLNVDEEPRLWAELRARSQRDTVPQIFIDEQHVGGSDDLAALEARGELNRLLGLDAT
jgi:glutaredoxin 3